MRNGERVTVRQFFWAIWHTRPGHRPYGLAVYNNQAFCLACGKEAPDAR